MKNSRIKTIISSIVAIVLCFATLIGSTYAWFTDSVTSSNNKIVAGTLKIDLELLDKQNGWVSLKNNNQPIFEYAKWEPGYTDVKILKVENEGTLALKWKAKFVAVNQLSAIADVIDVFVCPSQTELSYPNNSNLDGYTKVGTVRQFINTIEQTTYGTLLENEVAYLGLALKMQESAGNEYQGLDLSGAFDIVIVATQATQEEDGFSDQYDNGAQYPTIPDKWDGTESTKWFTDDPTAETFTLSTAEDLAGLASLVDGTVTMTVDEQANIPADFNGTFEGKTFKLAGDVDLYTVGANGEPVCFQPIGSYRQSKAFKGTFDGQGHTIKNLYQNTWALDIGYGYGDLGMGLFGLVRDATIKNLVIDGAEISGESALCGTIAGTAYGNSKFENITVKNANVADYQYYAGGLVGWASGNHEYVNCVIDESTTIGGQWGDFGNCNGGVIGGVGGSAEIKLKDCVIACRIDAVNDVVSAYQNYGYRNSGMIIGNTGKYEEIDGVKYATAPQLTCENVTVIYGDWANYTYCEFSSMSYPYVRVQSGTSVEGYYNIRYGRPVDANGNTVYDDNHVHNEGEDHHLLIQFDQLYGGDYKRNGSSVGGVYGRATHEGVTVVYNNR